MAMVKHIFLTSATARGFLAAVCALSFAVPCAFPLAASGSALSSIGFDGDGCLRSILGNFSSGFYLLLR